MINREAWGEFKPNQIRYYQTEGFIVGMGKCVECGAEGSISIFPWFYACFFPCPKCEKQGITIQHIYPTDPPEFI